MKVKVSEATAKQLRKFGNEVLGLDIKARDTAEAVRAMVSAVWEGDEFELTEDEAPVAAKPIMERAGTDNNDKVKIIIQKVNSPGGSDPVFAAVNGRGIWLPRGEVIEVPRKYMEVLEHAQEAVYEQLPEGGINPVPRMVHVYPFQRVA